MEAAYLAAGGILPDVVEQPLAGDASEAARMIRIQRAYEPPARGDGRRILVERLWPRGMTKKALAADAWLKDVAPSTELRKWFGHRVERWAEFQRRYKKELDANPDAWKSILEDAGRGTVTLLYGAHDTLHNGALVLRDYLTRRASGARARRGTTRRALRRGAHETRRTASMKPVRRTLSPRTSADGERRSG